jgi:ribosomal-protein-alanine N-acetyltransferase
VRGDETRGSRTLGAMSDLASARLRLRPIASSDRDRLHAIFRDPYVRRYLWDSVLVTHTEVDEVIAASAASFRERGLGVWSATERAAGDASPIIGFGGLRPHASGALGLIYGFLPEHWGRGYATELSRAVMQHAFALGQARLYADTDLENKASERVMRKLGMRFAGSEVRDGLPTVYYAIDRADFRA